MFLGLRKGKALEKRQNGKKIENGKTYFGDLELILYRCRQLKHPEVTLVYQGAFRVCLHGDKSTIDSGKRILKFTLYIAVVNTYTTIQDWSCYGFPFDTVLSTQIVPK